MSISKLKRIGLGAAMAGIAALALGACSDGYSRGYYSSDSGRAYHGRSYDRDRDGIPNRYDRDRDGDGVPNRYDDRPSNPHRD